MTEGESDTSSIDLSVGFFSAILMLFVFVVFNLNTPEPDLDLDSLGQADPILTSIPGGWSATVQPGHFALLGVDRLYILDLSRLAEGVADPLVQVSSDAGWAIHADQQGFAPNQFRLDVTMSLPEPEPALVRSIHDLTDPDAPCPDAIVYGPLNLVVSTSEVDLVPAMVFLDRCALAVRIEPSVFDPAADTVRFAFSRTTASFVGERMFR